MTLQELAALAARLQHHYWNPVEYPDEVAAGKTLAAMVAVIEAADVMQFAAEYQQEIFDDYAAKRAALDALP